MMPRGRITRCMGVGYVCVSRRKRAVWTGHLLELRFLDVALHLEGLVLQPQDRVRLAARVRLNIGAEELAVEAVRHVVVRIGDHLEVRRMREIHDEGLFERVAVALGERRAPDAVLDGVVAHGDEVAAALRRAHVRALFV